MIYHELHIQMVIVLQQIVGLHPPNIKHPYFLVPNVSKSPRKTMVSGRCLILGIEHMNIYIYIYEYRAGYGHTLQPRCHVS